MQRATRGRQKENFEFPISNFEIKQSAIRPYGPHPQPRYARLGPLSVNGEGAARRVSAERG